MSKWQRVKIDYSLDYKEKWGENRKFQIFGGEHKLAKTQVYKLFILTIPFTQMHIHTQCTCIHISRDVYIEVFVTKGGKNYKWSISNNQGLFKQWYIQKQWNVKKPFQRMRQISNGIKKASMIFIKKASLRTVYEIYRYTCLCIFPHRG